MPFREMVKCGFTGTELDKIIKTAIKEDRIQVNHEIIDSEGKVPKKKTGVKGFLNRIGL